MLRGRVFPRRAPGPGARARVCTQAGVDLQAGPDSLLVPVLAERPLSRPTWRGVLLVWGNSGAASACPVHTSDLKVRPQGLGCETSLLPERLRAAIIQDTGFLLRHPEEGTPASDRWPKWSPWPGHNAVELLTQKHRPGCGALGSAPRLVCLLSEFSVPGRHTHLRVTAFSYAPSTLPRNPGDPSPGHAPSSPGAGAGPFFLLPTLPSSSGLLRWALPTQPPSRPLATPHCMCDISILPLGGPPSCGCGVAGPGGDHRGTGHRLGSAEPVAPWRSKTAQSGSGCRMRGGLRAHLDPGFLCPVAPPSSARGQRVELERLDQRAAQRHRLQPRSCVTSLPS